jgi:hypothetical protein
VSAHGNPAAGDRGVPGIHCGLSNDPANTLSTPRVQDLPRAASRYAAGGIAVFPCWPRSKVPATRHGFHDASSNPTTVRRWWLRRPDYNIAIATGTTTGLLVLDIDGVTGAASLQLLEAEHGSLPRTRCSITAAGCHLWFAIHEPVPSSVARVGAGLDVRADRASAIAPPSIHPDGPTYRWLNYTSAAPAPDWLIRLAHKPPTIPHIERQYDGPPGAYGMAALEAEISALAHALPGTRNAALNRASFCLYQLVAGGELDGEVVREHLIYAATVNGLVADDGLPAVLRTIASGRRAGMQNPRFRRCAS